MSSSFIDEPVRMLLQYFFNTIWNYINIALRLARFTALLGILWCSLQVAFGTMEVRKFFAGIITKFFAFFLIMALYPSFVQGLQKFAIEVGKRGSGQAATALTKELEEYKLVLENNIAKKEADFAAAAQRLEEAKAAWGDMGVGKKILTAASPIFGMFIPENRELLRSVNDYGRAQKVKEKSETSATGDQQKLLAIKGLLASNNDSASKTDSYFLDIDMKDVEGKSLGWLSPDAIARISVLAGEILTENEWTYDVMVNAYYDNVDEFNEQSEEEKQKFLDEVMLGKKKLTIMHMPLGAVFRLIIVYIAVGFLYITTIGCLLQYIMAITEYAICSSYAIVIVPCMLFDGLKDMANKVLPMLMAQAVKLSILTTCMFFNAWLYLQIASKVTLTGEMFGAKMFFYVVFDGFLTFVLCLNGPKLASVIMTGQPQMSMGEFVQAAGAVAAGAVAAKKAASWGSEKLSKGARKGVSGLGTLNAAAHAAKGTWDAFKTNNGGKGSLSAGLQSFGSALGEIGRSTGNSLRQKGANWLNTGKFDGGAQGNVSIPSAGFSGSGTGGISGSGEATTTGVQSSSNSSTSSAGSSSQTTMKVSNTSEASNAIAQDGGSVAGLDAQGNPVSSKFQNSVAQRYEDVQANNGSTYTGKMGVGSYIGMRGMNAYQRAFAKAMSKSNVKFNPSQGSSQPDPGIKKNPPPPSPALPPGNQRRALPMGSGPILLPSSQKDFDNAMWGDKEDAIDVKHKKL